MNNLKKSSGFVLISALIALTIVSALAAIQLEKAQSELKLNVLQKDAWNALNACYSAQNVAVDLIINQSNATSSKITIDLSNGDFNPLYKNPTFQISGTNPTYTITTTCYGTKKNVSITTEATFNKTTKKIVKWNY